MNKCFEQNGNFIWGSSKKGSAHWYLFMNEGEFFTATLRRLKDGEKIAIAGMTPKK